MFCRVFGNYLLNKGILTEKELNTILQYRKSHRVKLGLIAVEQKFLTPARADEINQLQMKMDKRFGDIAVEKGYLTEGEVSTLLGLQGNPYLMFVQGTTENGILSKEKIDACLLTFQKEGAYTDAQIEALKNGDIDLIVSAMVRENSSYCEIISLAIKNIIRFASTDIAIGETKKTTSLKAAHIALQRIAGDYSVTMAFTCDGTELLEIASPFAKEQFDSVDSDALDAVCEFINCINGLYASKLSQENIELDMLPPVFVTDGFICADSEFCVLPIEINGKWINLVTAVKIDCDIR